jgi:DNA polymerase elongation subunit (family B)
VKYSGQVKFWDNFIYNKLREKNVQIPPYKKTSSRDYTGGYVKNPIPAKYRWIVTVDLTSLHPSIIMSGNLSPETKVRPAIYTVDDLDKFIDMEANTSEAVEKDCSILANGALFSNTKKGIFVWLTESMFEERKRNKKIAIQANIDIEAIKDSNDVDSKKMIAELRLTRAAHDAKQMAFKIALNSLYGATACEFFRYHDTDVAEGITLTSQLIIRFISNRLNVKLNELFKTNDIDYVIFNDTDSAGLDLSYLVDNVFGKDQSNTQKIVDFLDKFEQTYIDPFMKDEFERLADYLNLFQNRISMKREVIADKGLWRGKKHYVLQVLDKEGARYSEPKLKMMGIETAKGSTPNIVRGSLEVAIRILLNEDEETLQNYVKQFKHEFYAASLQEIAFPRGVSSVDDWTIPSCKDGVFKKGTPIHVRGSLVYNAQIAKQKLGSRYPKISNGDKIKFLYMDRKNPTRSHVIAFPDNVLPAEFGFEKYIDKDLQFEKTFLDPLKTFANIVGWNTEKVATLDDFFS